MDDLYTAVVHDVKNQLAELALHLGNRGDAQAEMRIAMNAARRLSEMLLIHRQESEQLAVHITTVNPEDFLQILAADYCELFPKINIQIDAQYAPDCTFFDDALVRMALGNALHNACRYAVSFIKLSAFIQDDMLVLEVLDDGPGFPDKILHATGHTPTAVSGSGTGLGLYLAHKIAQLHRLHERCGSVELSNVPSARFRLLLP